MLDEIAEKSQHKPHRDLIQFVKDRPGHDRRYAMDIRKIQRTLGWEPRHTWQSGLLKTVQWYLDNPDWVAAIQRQGEYQEWMERNYEKRGERS